MRILKWIIGSCLLLALSCQEKEKLNPSGESILRGKTNVVIDQTITPVIEDEVAIFESEYDADIELVSKTESEAVNSLLNDSVQIAVLTRDLTSGEKERFKEKKIIPKSTKFATDAIAFIRNKSNIDTLIALSDVYRFMQGNSVIGIKGLVFDNLNSSTINLLRDKAGIKEIPSNGIFSFKTNEEAIRYVGENDGMIGVIGLNWLSQPEPEMQKYMEKVSVLSVKGFKHKNYYSPTQNNLAEGKYPLARDLFVVNCQGFSGLGMGLASFIAGERGQRIILKSGLLPTRIPGRKILIRNQISKTNN